MAEEVHVDRGRDPLTDDVDLLARLFDREHGAWQGTERATLGCRNDKLRIHRACHRRQHDRKFSLEKIDQSAVGPHGLLIQKTEKRKASLPGRLPSKVWMSYAPTGSLWPKSRGIAAPALRGLQ